jgi:hypothetical protein
MCPFIAKSAPPDRTVLPGGILHHVPNLDNPHRVGREKDEVRQGASRVEKSSERLDRPAMRGDGTNRG